MKDLINSMYVEIIIYQLVMEGTEVDNGEDALNLDDDGMFYMFIYNS